MLLHHDKLCNYLFLGHKASGASCSSVCSIIDLKYSIKISNSNNRRFRSNGSRQSKDFVSSFSLKQSHCSPVRNISVCSCVLELVDNKSVRTAGAETTVQRCSPSIDPVKWQWIHCSGVMYHSTLSPSHTHTQERVKKP